MEDERKVSPNYCAVKWGVIDSKTNRQKNGQLSWVLNIQSLLLLYKGTTIWFWGGEGLEDFFNRNIYFIFRIKLFIFYIGQIKLSIFIFVVFSILDWSKSEGLKFFFSPSSRSKSNGRPLNQHFSWLYNLSVQRGRIEYEGETSV